MKSATTKAQCRMKPITFFFIILSMNSVSAAERWAVPDPQVTPGAVNPAAHVEALCTQTSVERKSPSLPAWVTEIELSFYNIPSRDSSNYVLDYLIPLSLGGANTLSNVWPQPRADVDRKAALETKLRSRVCAAFRDRPQDAAEVLSNAQRYLAEDWTAAYAVYVNY